MIPSTMSFQERLIQINPNSAGILLTVHKEGIVNE
jgi:hypothetical protein